MKTKKQCGLNEHWSRSRPPALYDEPVPIPTTSTINDAFFFQPLPMRDPPEPPVNVNHYNSHINLGNLFGSVQIPTPGSSLLSWESPSTDLPLPLDPVSDGPPHLSYPGMELHRDAADFDEIREASPNSVSHMSMVASYGSGTFGSDLLRPNTATDLEQSCIASEEAQNTISSTYRVTTTSWKAQGSSPSWERDWRRTSHQHQAAAPNTVISPFGHSHGLMATCNNHLVTDSLLRIYHDVLENNLACWLVEDTCPYKLRPRNEQILIGTSSSSSSRPTGSEESSSREWGSVWSNRMYKRVKDLDRAARSIGLIQLTRGEDQKATKALNMSIMAFAAQWAQGARRREKFTDFFETGADDDDGSSEFGYDVGADINNTRDEFEQHFQLHLWESARRTLDETANLESFRVIYAELILGLVQKPWLAQKSDAGFPTTFFGDDSTNLRDLIFSQIKDIINEEGPSIYLDRASRKIHALKFRYEALDAGVWCPSSPRQFSSKARSDSSTGRSLTEKQRGTIGLLYWLAVMFDTVSSSINQRPVTVADEDCQHDLAGDQFTENLSYSLAHPTISEYRWKLCLFSQDDPERPVTLRWPCTYDEAAKAITKSAAVKVLLFRYLSYLQNSMRKQQNSHNVEDIIHDVTKVYRYWNTTHGILFRDMIKAYNTVPARLKSWFPCIHIPWHLGSLLLADLIDVVDENRLGSDEGRIARANCNLAARIRRSSAIELSDLAKVTTPQGEDEATLEEQLPSYHFAVNEGTLLTEPWTVLLIRAFAKACIFHLTTAEDLRHSEWEILGQESQEYQDSLTRSDACVKALWFLGRKSEMARSLSQVFAGAMCRLERKELPANNNIWKWCSV